MRRIPVVRKLRAVAPGLLLIALAALALACGPAAQPDTAGGVAPTIPAATAMPAASTMPAATAVPAATSIPAATAMPATTAVPAARLPAVGTQVGARVPDFTLKLAGGSQVTSQELLAQHKPTFLFFFATW